MAKKSIIFFVGIAIVFSVVYYRYNKPPEGVAGKPAAAQITASELFSLYVNEEAAADRKYLDAVVEVTGQVDEIVLTGSNTIILLNTGDDGGRISCSAATGMNTTGIKKGATLTIKGVCKGFNIDVNLNNCVIVE